MTIAENLNKIWSEFRKVGITDDLVVIEYLARLLLSKALNISIDKLPYSTQIKTTESRITGFLTDYPIEEVKKISEQLTKIIDGTTNLVSTIILPRHPTNISNLEVIHKELESAINQAENNIPHLFNHHILFRLSTRQSGGRYPTPRHITKFIYNLAQIEPHHSLADFACGSGGFLVERELTIYNFDKT